MCHHREYDSDREVAEEETTAEPDEPAEKMDPTEMDVPKFEETEFETPEVGDD